MKYGAWIKSTTYINFDAPLYCIYQISSFQFTNWRFRRRYDRYSVKEVKTLEKIDLHEDFPPLIYNRVAEHMWISNLTAKHLKNVKKSAISDHLLQCNCAINFDGFNILATDSNKSKRLLRDILLIKRGKHILNMTIK